MRKHSSFVLGAALLVGAVQGIVAPRVAAAEPAPAEGPVTATLLCPPVDAPGRVRCSAQLTAGPGTRIAWADLVLLPTPEGLVPLRARIGPTEAAESRETSWRFDLAVVARRRGEAPLSARVRVVACVGDRCSPIVRDVQATVTVRE